jgi:hypothetical protein
MKGKTFIFALVLWGLSSTPLAAQGLLPSSFGAWASSGAPSLIPAAQIEQLANDRANILREYGISAGERRDYANGTGELTVTLYRMVDPSAAFGAFTFLREPDMTPLTLNKPVSYSAGDRAGRSAGGAAAGRGRVLLVVGNFLLDLSSAKAQVTDTDLTAVAGSVSGQADRRPYPLIGYFLPKAGLIPGSERYVLGPLALAQAFPPGATNHADWAGFGSSAEAIVGRYKLPGPNGAREALLLVLLYPTQQLAADRYEAVSKSFALNGDPSQANGRPFLFGARSSALIALLAGAESPDVAANFLNQIHYASDVTWDEPTHELTDPSISTIVVGAIVDSGAIMLLALAAGIGFGGFRLLVKLVLPGRVFDRNEDVEILQLGINSKPIEAKDFYLLNSSR